MGIFQQKITLSNTNTLCLGSLFHICILLPFFYKIKKLFVVQKQKNSCFCRCEPIYFPWLSTPFCVSSLAVTLVYHTKIRYKMNIFTWKFVPILLFILCTFVIFYFLFFLFGSYIDTVLFVWYTKTKESARCFDCFLLLPPKKEKSICG